MGSFKKIRENILGVDIISLIFRGIEEKTDSANLGKLCDKIALLQTLHSCYTKDTPFALTKKIEAEIVALQCLTGEKPGIIAECGIDLNASGVKAIYESTSFLCIKGFAPSYAMDWNDIAKASMSKSSKPIGINIANHEIFNEEEREKLKELLSMAYPWNAFEEAHIIKGVLTLINSLTLNPFVYKMMLASLLPDSTETLLLTQCADGHCRIAAHWGPEPLSFRIAGLHPK